MSVLSGVIPIPEWGWSGRKKSSPAGLDCGGDPVGVVLFYAGPFACDQLLDLAVRHPYFGGECADGPHTSTVDGVLHQPL
jgi:hypothetical protein